MALKPGTYTITNGRYNTLAVSTSLPWKPSVPERTSEQASAQAPDNMSCAASGQCSTGMVIGQDPGPIPSSTSPSPWPKLQMLWDISIIVGRNYSIKNIKTDEHAFPAVGKFGESIVTTNKDPAECQWVIEKVEKEDKYFIYTIPENCPNLYWAIANQKLNTQISLQNSSHPGIQWVLTEVPSWGELQDAIGRKEAEHKKAIDRKEAEHKQAIDRKEAEHKQAIDHKEAEHKKAIEKLQGEKQALLDSASNAEAAKAPVEAQESSLLQAVQEENKTLKREVKRLEEELKKGKGCCCCCIM